jgi:hypothetical protein
MNLSLFQISAAEIAAMKMTRCEIIGPSSDSEHQHDKRFQKERKGHDSSYVAMGAIDQGQSKPILKRCAD